MVHDCKLIIQDAGGKHGFPTPKEYSATSFLSRIRAGSAPPQHVGSWEQVQYLESTNTNKEWPNADLDIQS